jgi:hypothetical protein
MASRINIGLTILVRQLADATNLPVTPPSLRTVPVTPQRRSRPAVKYFA